jgi:glycosyltransferase involved in cell wall biosynthesis
MTSTVDCRCIVLSIGAPQPEPWWWPQLEGEPLRDSLRWERLSVDGRRQQDLTRGQLLRLSLRIAGLLWRARREGVDYLVTFESDLSCYLVGLLQRLPGFRGPRHVIVQFITRERDDSLRGRMHTAIGRLCLGSVHRLVCSARAEIEYYGEVFGWPAEKFAFVPFHTDDRLLNSPAADGSGDYIIAAGRSYRDYATLVAAVAGTGIRTVIVCGRSGPGVDPLPPEVEVVAEIPFEDLVERMRRARLVVLPLQPRRISIGQSVLLQAMALGQAVITTRTAGTADYLDEGRTGLFVPPSDPGALREAIRRVYENADMRASLGQRARAAIASRHRPRQYAQGVARAIQPARG